MRIKIAILDSDINYLNRIISVLNNRYENRLQVYAFSQLEKAFECLEKEKISVFLASDQFTVDWSLIPKRCGYAYLTEDKDVESISDVIAICKYQRIDLIYKQILGIYSEHSDVSASKNSSDEKTKILVFSSPSGGVGTSTIAASCAVHLSQKGYTVLYLNLESYGGADVFFNGEGAFGMSDVIFALKSKKSNLQLKLESCVKQDALGPFFFSQSRIALDLLELKPDEIGFLISSLRMSGSYDFIIVDTDYCPGAKQEEVWNQANTIVWVCDGSEVSINKTNRAYNAIATLEQNKMDNVLDRLVLIYNKFSNKTGKRIVNQDLYVLDGLPRYDHASTKQIIGEVSQKAFFDRFLD